MSRTGKGSSGDPTPLRPGEPARRPDPARGEALRRAPDARVALDLGDDADTPLQERFLDDDPREAEHQRRLQEERQAHQQAIELIQLKSALRLKRQNTPAELYKTKAQAFLAVSMGLIALGTLCYLLLRSDTPMELKKDILKFVGGAIGGVGIGYAVGRQGPAATEE
jgi:hypothetical protein